MPGPDANGHEVRRRRTRQALRDSASTLFEAQGFDGTTVADIARHAQVSERTFYVHFPSKEDILFAHVQDFATLALQVAQDDDSPLAIDRVRAAILALIDAASDETSIARQAESRAALGARGDIPRSLASPLVNLAQSLALRIADATGTPTATVAPMVGAALGAVGGAGLDAALGPNSIHERREAMIRALDAALRGFREQAAGRSGERVPT